MGTGGSRKGMDLFVLTVAVMTKEFEDVDRRNG